MKWVVDGNAAGFAEFGRHALDPVLHELLTQRSRAALDRYGPLLDRRRDHGFVRQCHGDLHLRNIVLLDGRPTLFDAIEFNDEIACIDVFYDLAFLLMDLWHRGLTVHANCLFNHYLAETGDLAGLELLPLFLSCRAAIRAKTDVTAAVLRQDDSDRQALVTAAGEYLRMAMSFLAPDAPRLIAIGGVSGSGKSTVAKRLAPSIGKAPGAVILRSDEIRKRMFHVDPTVRLGAAAYTADVSRAVYQILTDRAALVLTRGQSVVVDAVFADPAERSRIEQVADAADVSFSGIWLEAPESILASRSERRSADASDADIQVIRAQLRSDTGPIEWSRVDSAGAIESVVASARDRLLPVPAALLRA